MDKYQRNDRGGLIGITKTYDSAPICAGKVNEFVDARMIIPEKAKRPDVPIHAPLHNNNVQTFGAL